MSVSFVPKPIRILSTLPGKTRFGTYCQTMSKRALIFLATGAEELEFITAADVLRRAQIEVVVAGLPDAKLIKCSRDINIKPDIGIKDAKSKGPYDILILPGGSEGTKALCASAEVGALLKDQETSGKYIAAICAAPTALKAHGIATGKQVTSYPAMKNQMLEGNYAYREEDVVVDGHLITSRGPGTALEFALTIVEHISGKDKAAEVAKQMLVKF